MRIKYPSALQGVIAASAPVAAFLGQTPAYDPLSFGEQVTRDASTAGGSTDVCAERVRQVWPQIFAHGDSASGRQTLQQHFKLCHPLNNSLDVLTLAYWLQSSFDFMAMGSYPFASSYMLNGNGVLPPYPLRVACTKMAAAAESSSSADLPATALFDAMREAVAVFYNATARPCFDINLIGNNETTLDGRLWDYLSCGQLSMPFARDGVHDMFWPQPWEPVASAAGCLLQFGEQTRGFSAHIDYGGADLSSVSNIFYTNGDLDPWKPGGITANVSASVVAYILPDVGHHIDLMFTNPSTPPSVYTVREQQVASMKSWIEQHMSRSKN